MSAFSRHLAGLPLSATSAFVALLAVGSASATLQAQSTRSWSVCFSSAINSCSSFTLQSTPTDDGFGHRTGTLIDLLARHQGGGGVVSGLGSVTFYGLSTGGSSDATPASITPQASGGAPVVPLAESGRWSAIGAVDAAHPADPFANYLFFSSSFVPGLSQFIGGCLGSAFDVDHSSSAYTCGPTAAYGMRFSTAAFFDAANVSRLALDVYAPDANADGLPDQASCNAPTDGSAGFGQDLGDPYFTAACTVSAASVVPEPSALALLAFGLIVLVAARAALRRRRHLGSSVATQSVIQSAAHSAASRVAMASMTAGLLGACAPERAVAPQSADPSAPTAPPVRTIVVSEELTAAVADAGTRVVPSLDASLQPAVATAVGALRDALVGEQMPRVKRALADLKAVLAQMETGTPADSASATPASAATSANASVLRAASADLAGLSLLVSALERELAAQP